MEHIPNIHYQQRTSNGVSGFEFFSLNQLFNLRQHPLDHNPFAPHRLNFYALICIAAGQVRHQVDFEHLVLQAGDCLLITPQQIHAWDASSQPQGYLMMFTDAFLHWHVSAGTLAHLHERCDFLHTHQLGKLPEHSRQFVARLQQLQTQAQGYGIAAAMGAELSLLLLALANSAAPTFTPQASPRARELYRNFRQLLPAHHTHSRNASYYAQQLGVSYKHLNSVCHAVAQHSAKAVVDAYMVLEAKRLLVTTTSLSKEIGFQLGFSEPTNFAKYFKRHTGQTAAQFRSSFPEVRDRP